MKKRILATVLALCIVFCALPFTAFAANEQCVEIELITDTLDAEINGGEEITVKLNIVKNTGFSFLWAKLLYDSNALEYVSSTPATISGKTPTVSSHDDDGSYLLLNVSSDNTPISATGILCEVTFKATDDYRGDTSLSLGLRGDNEKNCMIYSTETYIPEIVPFVSYGLDITVINNNIKYVMTELVAADNQIEVANGEEFTVKFNITENTGFSFLWAKVMYDADALEYVSATPATISGKTPTVSSHDDDGSYLLINVSSDTSPITDTGLLCEFVFRAKSDYIGDTDITVGLRGDNEKNCMIYSAETFIPEVVPFISQHVCIFIVEEKTEIPATPTVESRVGTVVTLTAVEGYEYSIDGITWQESNIFTGIDIKQSYNFYQRAVDTTVSSDALEYTITPEADELIWLRTVLLSGEQFDDMRSDYNLNDTVNILDLIYLKKAIAQAD